MINDIGKYITLVEIDLLGNDYQLEQESIIRETLEDEPYDVIVRGKHNIAAGAGLSHDIVVFIAGAIASGLLYDLLKYLMSAIQEAFRSIRNDEAPLRKVTFKTVTCDFVISSNCNAGIFSEYVDYEQLLLQMEAFVEREANSGSPVIKIESPCDLKVTNQGWECVCRGVGNYSLWKVEYKCGEKWPEVIYDACNDSYIKLSDRAPICVPEDLFYSVENYKKGKAFSE